MSVEEPLSGPQPVDTRGAWRLFERFFRDLLFGQVLVRMGADGARLYRGRFCGGAGELVIHHPWRFATRVVVRGEIGFAESYIAGHWSSPDLTALLGVLYDNLEHLGGGPQGMRWGRWLNRLTHLRRRNHRRNSRRNIARHYDLGNDFYRLWLDHGMTYSSALFAPEAGDESLEQAQARKYERLLDAIDARPGEHLLEIGSGWGGLAEAAARRGLRVTSITLSRAQLDYARTRLAAAGFADLVEFRLADYREVRGSFDHAISIEMMEAVGEAYWSTYYDTLRRLVRPGGRIALQVITIHEDDFPLYRRTPDFVQLYIFPGGMLPSPRRMTEEAARAGLRIRDTRWCGDDYAETLRRWRARFHAVDAEVAALGYDAAFRRMWDYYLAYCEAGFRAGCVDLVQTLLEVPRRT
ncbi:SAM-dependent methyltransferase [Marichromatium gracile]|uniref:Cyclopropane-fatty-acyl-phospholipid synthase n=1 Tax=Marichromatium gracile TaxID=1048 RepID=A0ABR5VJQ5_MARGR|nr:cyclopropane-fatty-acyl-phospholipid synthase family protein [Marichromatium gracile]KXX64458.1 cyclopropane-fatty-acyl-phospholipid synthase [Marichromatium gracile]